MSVGRGSQGALSNGSHNSLTDIDPSNDLEPPLDENEINNNNANAEDELPTRSEKTEAWWSVGEYLEGRGGVNLTHQSAKFTLTGNRVFGPQQNPDEVWDLTDSIIELYEKSQQQDMQNGSGPGDIEGQVDIPLDNLNVEDWLEDDHSHGFIRVFPASLGAVHVSRSQMVPCALNTSAHRICLMLGISISALHVQLHGDVIRRMDPYEHPLALQNELLAGLGFTDLGRIQREGALSDLSYLIRFYAGKPLFDSTFSRNQLQSYLEVKKGGMLQQWVRRMCVLSGTRLLIYKDKFKRSQPSPFQLAKGFVEEVKMKGHDFCLKLTVTVGGERIIWLSFSDASEYNKWFRRCKKATDKLPTTADLSNCHLELLPENIFINEQLALLNLRHNVLRERPLDEDTYTIGWLDDLHRFHCLRSLNVADNNLVQFPASLCTIKTLVELNIASNRLQEIPPEISQLSNLQALHVHNNHLSSLPIEMLMLRKLFILVLAFNHFTVLPPVVAQMTNVRTSEVENIIMAGNDIDHIPSETLIEMKYVKKVDLRMNQLTLNATETMKFTVLEHLTHLDIRDNQVTDLDIRSLKTLEYLNVERNDMVSLQVNGMSLKNLFAGHNCIERMVINPKPEWLLQMDLSYNCLTQLPDWLSDCFFLQKLWVNCNLLNQLPPRLFNEARKLKSLRADHNRLPTLPPVDFEGSLALEEVLLHHNHISALPPLFLARANKLRVLNLTKNRLSTLPPLNPNQDLNRVQELYLSGNSLGDSVLEVLSGFSRLKVLHLAHNEIYNMADADIAKLEMLQELNISGNQLRSLPVAIGQLPRLVVLRAHSNILHSLPDFKHAASLRILDVGHNQLLNVSVTHLMASQLNLLDMSCNAQLKVDPKEFKTVKHRKNVCLVDLTGQNRLLPGLKSKRKGSRSDRSSVVNSEAPRSTMTSRSTDMDMDPDIPWKVGFSETSGMRNKLCVATLKLLHFRSENESVFGMFDGGHNNEVPSLLLEHMEDVLLTEQSDKHTSHSYMKYAMLNAHGRLKGAGQRLGASALLCHMHRVSSEESMKHYTMSIANVGDVEAVLCRHGDALLLTRKFVTDEDRDECQRVYKSDGIITEDNKVNGTTKNTRLLGCGYLYPHVIPDPYSNTIALRNDDEFVIIANRGLWHYITYTEAVEEIYETGNPVVAAKQLQDLAQAYGSKENIAVLVVRLNTDKGPSLARLRQNRSMSIDDVEAAVRHEAKLQRHWQRRAAKQKQHRVVDNALLIQKKLVQLTEQAELADPPDEPSPPAPPPACIDVPEDLPAPPPELLAPPLDPSPPPSDLPAQDLDFPPPPPEAYSPPPDVPAPALKPLPNQRYLKKNAATEWEGILQSRLSQEVKDLEMKQMSSSFMEDINDDGEDGNIGLEVYVSQKSAPWQEERLISSTQRMYLPDAASPLLRTDRQRSRTRGSIANTIALFENLNAEPPVGGRSVRSISVPREHTREPSPAPPALKKSRSPPPPLKSPPPTSPTSRIPRNSASKSIVNQAKLPSGGSSTPPVPPKNFNRPGAQSAAPVASAYSRASGNTILGANNVKKTAPKLLVETQSSSSSGEDNASPRANVSSLVRMFGAANGAKLNESVEIRHLDDKGSLRVYEVAKL